MAGEPVPFSSIKEKVTEVVRVTVTEELDKKQYTAKEGPTWAHTISEKVVRQLPDISKDFKYSVSCIILNKNEGGLHMSSSCYWNAVSDGNVVFKWENDNMYCIVSLFGFAI